MGRPGVPEGLGEGCWVGAVVEELGTKEGDDVTGELDGADVDVGALVGDDATGALEGALMEVGAKDGDDVVGAFEGRPWT